MASYFLEGLEYGWTLVRETPSSQKFMVDVDKHKSLTAQFDIHYTRPEIAHVSVCFIGNQLSFTDGLSCWLFDDLEKIIRRHGDYKIIDYSLVYSDRVINGNLTMGN